MELAKKMEMQVQMSKIIPPDFSLSKKEVNNFVAFILVF
jgi:hypothetical protein